MAQSQKKIFEYEIGVGSIACTRLLYQIETPGAFAPGRFYLVEMMGIEPMSENPLG